MFPSEMALRIMLISSAVSDFFVFLNGAFCIPKRCLLYSEVKVSVLHSPQETVCFSA